MHLNLELLMEKEACESGLAWYTSHGQPNTVEGCVSALLADPDPSTTLPYANWLLSNLLNEDDCRRYAIFAARQVLHIFETAYPEDNLPHLAIEAAENYLVTHSEADRDAARAAGNDAWDAERIARAAWPAGADAWSAWADARADAWAAWTDARDDAWAAWTDARADAWAAWTDAGADVWAVRAAAGAERAAAWAARAAGAVAGDLMYRAVIEYGVTLYHRQSTEKEGL
jgi:hypothetical protein